MKTFFSSFLALPAPTPSAVDPGFRWKAVWVDLALVAMIMAATALCLPHVERRLTSQPPPAPVPAQSRHEVFLQLAHDLETAGSITVLDGGARIAITPAPREAEATRLADNACWSGAATPEAVLYWRSGQTLMRREREQTTAFGEQFQGFQVAASGDAVEVTIGIGDCAAPSVRTPTRVAWRKIAIPVRIPILRQGADAAPSLAEVDVR